MTRWINESIPTGFDDEGLARDDRRTLRRQAYREGLQVAALEAPVLSRGELGPGLDGHDARGEARVRARLRPDGYAPPCGKGREPLLGHFDAKVGRLDL